MAIAIEAAELMEVFQWSSTDESEPLAQRPDVRQKIEEELADVLIYCFSLANRLSIDVDKAVRQKIENNARKYPVDLYFGRHEREE